MQKKEKEPRKVSLREYLDFSGIKHCFFAQAIGVQPATLYRVLAGYAPTLKMAIDIEKYTQGVVSVYNWDLTRTAHCVNPTDNDNKKNDKNNTKNSKV